MINHPSVDPAESAGDSAPSPDHPVDPQQPPAPERPAIPPMILLRKPNRQSVLKNLPRERQQEIIEYLEGTPQGAIRHTFQETVDWLKTNGIQISITALRNFRDWWELAHLRGAAAAERDENGFREVPDTSLPESHLMRTAQAVIEEEAMRNRDAKLYVALQRLRHRERALELQQLALQIRNDIARNRAELQERATACREHLVNLAIWKAHAREEEQKRKEAPRQQAKEPKTEEDFDNTEIIEALRQAYLADLEEVLASGDVVIPE